MGRLRRALWVAPCVGLLGLTTACGIGDSTADAGQALGGGTGDTAPGELVRVGEANSAPEESEPKPTQQSLPDGPDDEPEEETVRLTALEQPDKEFGKPKLPEKPAEDSDELTHIVYLLESSSWTAAGMVDEEHTETDCSISSSELTQEGSYDFGCTVSLAGAKIEYDVTAEVKDKKVPITLDTEKLPVSEEKAVHEATRQSFKPARVTCDIVGVEAIRVGKQDGFTCWVTDVENQRTTYFGEVMEDGQLALRQQ